LELILGLLIRELQFIKMEMSKSLLMIKEIELLHHMLHLHKLKD